MSDPRLMDLGNRIAAAMRRHGFTERELLTRSIKRQVAAAGFAKMVFTFKHGPSGWTGQSRSAA